MFPQGFNRFETLLSLALNFPGAHELALFAHHHAQSNSQSHCGKSSSIKTTYVYSICKQPCRCEDRTLTTISSSTRPHRAKPLYPSQPGLIGRSFCILLTQSSLSKAFVLSSTQVSLGRASPSSTRLYWVETLYAPQPGLIGQSLYILLNQALSGGASISSSTGPHRAKPLYSFRHGSGHFTFWAGTSAGSAKHAPPAPGGHVGKRHGSSIPPHTWDTIHRKEKRETRVCLPCIIQKKKSSMDIYNGKR